MTTTSADRDVFDSSTITPQQLNELEALIDRSRRNEWWQKHGWTIVCTGAGGALGHMGCMAQGVSVLAFGAGLGALSIPVTLATIPAVHVTLNRIKPPKDKIERYMRLRGSLVAGATGLLVTAALSVFAPHNHYDVRPAGSYGAAKFEELSVFQQRYIQNKYEKIWLPTQPKSEQARLQFEASSTGQSVTSILWQQYGPVLLDKCDNITQELAQPPTLPVGAPGSSITAP